ncbi:hypothetical protein FRC16_004558 [Serendipita sp. 398]|nr:hypothetical protein FRC16_004558 [Serendipita sp. 398]
MDAAWKYVSMWTQEIITQMVSVYFVSFLWLREDHIRRAAKQYNKCVGLASSAIDRFSLMRASRVVRPEIALSSSSDSHLGYSLDGYSSHGKFSESISLLLSKGARLSYVGRTLIPVRGGNVL